MIFMNSKSRAVRRHGAASASLSRLQCCERRAYVSNEDGHTVTVIDTSQNEVVDDDSRRQAAARHPVEP